MWDLIVSVPDHCLSCYIASHLCSTKKILNTRTLRPCRNLVYKLQKQFLDVYTYRTSLKRGERLSESH